jgi:hypothetical protein
MRILFIFAFIALAGCKQSQTPEQLAAQQNAADDATCKSFGLQFGTQAYADCRLRLREQALAKAKVDAEAAAAADAQIMRSLEMMRPPQPQPVVTTTCNTYMGTTNCTFR